MPKKVLFLITKGNWGGAQRYVFDMARAARASGYDVAVGIGGDVSGLLFRRLAAEHIRTIAIPTIENKVSLTGILRARRALRAVVQTELPDIVHLNSSLVGLAGALAARSEQVNHIIFTAHGWAFNEDRPFVMRIVIGLMQYLTVALSHTTICVSEAVKKDAWFMWLTARKQVVIHNGVEEPQFIDRSAARTAVLPHHDDQFWFGVMAELHPTKRLSDAIEALAKLTPQMPNALLLIMGEGKERQRLESLAKKLHVSERVHLVGHIENAPSYLQALDVFILPSRSEGLGYALIEAGFAGLPAIATQVGGMPEVVEHDVSGLLVEPLNPHKLAEAMHSLATNRTLAHRLGNALQVRVREKFSLISMTTRTLELYRS